MSFERLHDFCLFDFISGVGFNLARPHHCTVAYWRQEPCAGKFCKIERFVFDLSLHFRNQSSIKEQFQPILSSPWREYIETFNLYFVSNKCCTLNYCSSFYIQMVCFSLRFVMAIIKTPGEAKTLQSGLDGRQSKPPWSNSSRGRLYWPTRQCGPHGRPHERIGPCTRGRPTAFCFICSIVSNRNIQN